MKNTLLNIKCFLIRWCLFKPIYNFQFLIEGLDKRTEWHKPKKYKWLNKLTWKLVKLQLK